MYKILDKVKSILGASTQQNPSSSTASQNTTLEPSENDKPPGRITWPPQVASLKTLGEIRDTNGRKTPRDLGRSIILGRQHFYMFADTFCFDDAGEFVGLISNTCAYIPDIKNPTRCSYWHDAPREPEFIPLTPEDEAYNRKNEGTGKRVANWAFGGIIEDGLDENGKGVGTGKGWIFNDKVLINDKGTVGMELVRVELRDGHKIHAEKVPGLSPFGEHEIRFGNISTFIDGGWVYLLGGSVGLKWPRNYMARIKYGDDFSQLSNYQYHTKAHGWQPSFSKRDDLSDVMAIIGHGMIFKASDAGPKGKPCMCIGVDKFLTSHLYLGVAEKPEGPWDIQNVCEIPRFLGGKSNTRYCLYMHEWGSDLGRGEMLISWSDDGQMGGMVVAAKLRLRMEESSPSALE